MCMYYGDYPEIMGQWDYEVMDGTFNKEDDSRDYCYDENYNNQPYDDDPEMWAEEELKEKKEQITLDTISAVYKEKNWKSFKDVDEDYLYARINEALAKEG